MDKELSSIIEGIDLKGIVKRSIKNSIPKQRIDESYVSEPKTYSQVSEFVSEKTKKSHMELYKGYVETLNGVSSELDTAPRGLSKVNSSHSDYRSLKLDETYNINAKWLHELFFANCFDPHSEIYMTQLAYLRIERDFGTFTDWQHDFMACAMSCGNGWAVLAYNIHLQRYVNTFVSNHSQDVMIGLYPVVVLDMWEHAYVRDYLDDKKSYLVAMLKEINWEVVEERFEKSESIAEAIR